MSYNPTFYRGDEMSMSLTSPMFARNMPKELEVNSFVKAVDPLDDAFVPRTLDDFYARFLAPLLTRLGLNRMINLYSSSRKKQTVNFRSTWMM